jgi:DNA modification methylase
MVMDRLAAAYWTPIGELAKWARNPRKNGPAIPQVARSIRKYGFVAPIVVWQSRSQIVAGHTRIAALESLLAQNRAFVPRDAPGPGLLPVRFHEFSDESEAAAYALADNKLSELADWDEEMLGQILGELRSIDETLLAHTGFGDAEIEALIRQASGSGPIQGAGEDPGAQIDRATELQEKWQTAPGQLWAVPSATVPGRVHRLLCGDSRRTEDALRVMDGDRARWCWTDPPYGVEYQGGTADHLRIENDSAKDLPELLRCAFAAADAVLLEGAPIYVAHPAGPLSIEFGRAFLGTGWHLHQTLVWVKDAMVLGHSDYHYQHEPLLYGWKGKNRSWYGGRDKVSTLAVPRPDRSELHPTMKPPALVAMCLQNSSRAGDLGFEPFSGSGTTLVAAEQTGRLCCGIEIDPRYVAVVLERLAGMGLVPRRT